MNCPPEDVWLELEAGAIDPTAGHDAEEHARTCARCQAVRAQLATLTAAIAEPLVPALDASRIARQAMQPRSGRRWWAVAAAALVAAGVSTLIVAREDARSRGAAAGWRERVSARIWEGTRAIEAGAELGADARFTLVIEGAGGTTPLFVMGLLEDSRNEVHWITPAWSDREAPPNAPSLGEGPVLIGSGPTLVSRLSVGFDDVADGPATLVTLVSERALSVLEVEAALRTGGELADAKVRSTPITVRRGTAP